MKSNFNSHITKVVIAIVGLIGSSSQADAQSTLSRSKGVTDKLDHGCMTEDLRVVASIRKNGTSLIITFKSKGKEKPKQMDVWTGLITNIQLEPGDELCPEVESLD